MNFIEGTLETATQFAFDNLQVPLNTYSFDGEGIDDNAANRKALLGVRPEHVVTGAALSEVPWTTAVEVDVVEPMGSDTLIWSNMGGRDFRFRVDGQSKLRTGDKVEIGFDPAKICVFDAESELRL